MKLKTVFMCIIMFTLVIASDNYKQSYNFSHGFKIEYPSDWTLTSGIMEATLFKASKNIYGENPITASVNVQVLNSYGHSMEKMTLNEVEYIMTSVFGSDNVIVHSKNRLTISNIPAANILFEVHLNGIDPFVQYAILLIKGKNLYTVSIGCPKNYYNVYRSEISHIANSFKFYK